MAKRTRLSGTPVVVIGSLSGKRHGSGARRRRHKSPDAAAQVAAVLDAVASSVRQLPGQAERLLSRPVPASISRHVPSRRKRKKIARRLQANSERLTQLAGGISAVLSVAATGAELLSALKGHEQDRSGDNDEEEDGFEEDEGDASDDHASATADDDEEPDDAFEERDDDGSDHAGEEGGSEPGEEMAGADEDQEMRRAG